MVWSNKFIFLMHISNLSSLWKSPGNAIHLTLALTAALLLSSVSSIARHSSGFKFNFSSVTLYISGWGFSLLTNDLFPIKSKSAFEIWLERLSNTASTLFTVVEVENASLILLSFVILIND